MMIPLCFVVGCLSFFISNVEVMSLLKSSILNTETKRSLRIISYYHSGYFVAFGIIAAVFGSFLYRRMSSLDFLESITSLWDLFATMLRRLENNEYTYQCPFGLSFQAVRCEIYGNINRMFILGSYQCLKYMQESFSYSDFNIFRILGFLSFANSLLRQIIFSIQPFKFFKLIINNIIVLSVCMIQAIYSVYNWRQIIQGISIEAIEVEEAKLLREDDFRLSPWLTIS